jgi:hypothetical protein
MIPVLLYAICYTNWIILHALFFLQLGLGLYMSVTKATVSMSLCWFEGDECDADHYDEEEGYIPCVLEIVVDTEELDDYYDEEEGCIPCFLEIVVESEELN